MLEDSGPPLSSPASRERRDAALLDRDLEYSSWLLPALRSVSTAFWISSLVRSADINAVEALSIFLTTLSSRTLALPVAPPPPSDDFACMPHDQLQDFDLALVDVVLRLALDQPHLAPLTMRNMSPTPGSPFMTYRESH